MNRTAVVAVSLAAILGLPFGVAEAQPDGPAHDPATANTCSPSGEVPAPEKTIDIFSPHAPDHVALKRGQSLRVVTHDHSYYGVSAAYTPRSRVLCHAHESATKHRKRVVFLARHRGRATIYATPRVAPGTGTATEALKVRVK